MQTPHTHTHPHTNDALRYTSQCELYHLMVKFLLILCVRMWQLSLSLYQLSLLRCTDTIPSFSTLQRGQHKCSSAQLGPIFSYTHSLTHSVTHICTNPYELRLFTSPLPTLANVLLVLTCSEKGECQSFI